MTEELLRPINLRRRGTAPGRVLLLMAIATATGAICWAMFGDNVRFALNLPPPAAHWTIPSKPADPTAVNGEVIERIRELKSLQQRTSDDVGTALQLLNAQQAAVKTLSDSVAGLQSKVEALQQRSAAPAVKKPTVSTPAKRPAAPQQIVPVQEPSETEPERTSTPRSEDRSIGPQ